MALTNIAAPRTRPSDAPSPATVPAESKADAPRLPYYPSLDGLRAVSVLAVLLFHTGWEHATGGFLGVSTFFTLSGFLITSLLLAEHRATEGIDARQFWSRRFRRLMPAAWLTLAIAVLYGSGLLESIGFAADAAQLNTLRGDVVAALAYVANWRFILDTQSYGDLFTSESPVLQFWSLAIEEQFYVIFPLVVMAVLGRRRLGRRRFGVVLLALTALSILSTVAFGYSDDRIYYGTDTRAAELLVGALLAVMLMSPRFRAPRQPVAPDDPKRGPDLTGSVVAMGAGAVALVACMAIMATTTLGSGWLYGGGLPLYALLSAAVIASCTAGGGPVAWLLALRPLVWLGRVSYGVYLYHWLIFMWLRQRRTIGAGPLELTFDTWWKLFLVGGLITLGVAALSYYFVEQPVRTRRLVTKDQARSVIPVAAVGLVATLLVVTNDPPPPPIDFAAAQEQLSGVDVPVVEPEAGDSSGSSVVAPAPPEPRIAVFGDSTALLTAVGLAQWMSESGEALPVGGRAWLGCSLGRGGERRLDAVGVATAPQGCDDWALHWAEAIAADQPDLAVVQVGVWEVADRRLPGDSEWRGPGDPVYDEFLLSEMRTAVDVLGAGDATVVFLTAPPAGAAADLGGGTDDPLRTRRLNELMAQVAEERPDQVAVIDLAGYLDDVDDERLRPDGVHFSPETAQQVSDDFLGPALVEEFDERWLAEWREQSAITEIPDPLRMLVIGDSTAGQLYLGLEEWNLAHQELQLAYAGEYGCGFGRGGRIAYQGSVGDVRPECDAWAERIGKAVTDFKPHVVLVLAGPFDVTDRMLAGEDGWRAPGDPIYDEFIRAEYEAVADTVASDGALVVWLTSPRIELGRAEIPPPPEPYAASDPARMDRLNEIIADLAGDRDDVFLVDLAGHLATYPGGELDPTVRPDGVHVTPESGKIVAGWLLPEITGLYQDLIDENRD